MFHGTSGSWFRAIWCRAAGIVRVHDTLVECGVVVHPLILMTSRTLEEGFKNVTHELSSLGARMSHPYMRSYLVRTRTLV